MDSLAFTKSPGERVEERHVPCIVDWRILFVGMFCTVGFISNGLLSVKEEYMSLALVDPSNVKRVYITLCFLMTSAFVSTARRTLISLFLCYTDIMVST